ncbi:putative RNA-directed DNA polymerase from transposon X-element [Mycena sanguinolenta]|uniref:Putative RNA-directed DNA polymerase from transposon X-element n=1 Tax=Mycena sanguinolenta TaxID=230812 RepID=A0A8H7CUY3_9AGAR|nr:putative RNA-directed DNA polymerase from transposon X-element [Mycena sanguinolenta]
MAEIVVAVTEEGGVNETAEESNSAFGPEKDQVICFSKKTATQRQFFGQKDKVVPEKRPNLVINGLVIKPSAAVKLVGIWLDENLTFKVHRAAMVAKGNEWVATFRRLAQVSKGVALKYIRRLYLSICLPRIFYGAEVALAPVGQRVRGANRRHDGRAVVRKLTSIQLRAAQLITGGISSSPGDIMCAHANLLPIHLAIDKLLQKAALRYATLPATHPLHKAVENAGRRHVQRHPHPLHFLMNAYKDVKQNLVEEIPATRYSVTWRPPIDVRVAEDKDEAKEWALAEPSRVQLFSDGSLIDGLVGAAGLLMVDGVVKRAKGVRLGTAKHYGVYEAEGVGKVLAMECLREEVDEVIEGVIPLGIDNRAAINTTTSGTPGPGHYIWDIFHCRLRKTRRMHPDFRLRVDWTPGHVDIPGNEAADEAAKRAAQTGSFGEPLAVLTRLPFGKSALALTHRRLLETAARKQFIASRRFARIKEIDPSLPSNKFLKLTTPLPRKHASLLFQLRAQHIPLSKHLFRLKKSPTPLCLCCGRVDETVDHFLHFCPAHAAARSKLYAASRSARRTKTLLSSIKLLPRPVRFHSGVWQISCRIR